MKLHTAQGIRILGALLCAACGSGGEQSDGLGSASSRGSKVSPSAIKGSGFSAADLALKAGFGGAPSDLVTGDYVDPRDGKAYTWVQHGDVQWMQQNMRYLGSDDDPASQWVSPKNNISKRALISTGVDEVTQKANIVQVDDMQALLCNNNSELCLDGEVVHLIGILERTVGHAEGDEPATSIELAKLTDGYQRYGVAYSQTSALYDVCNTEDGWRLPTVELAEEGEKLGGEMAGLLESLTARSGGLGQTSVDNKGFVTNEYLEAGLLLRSTAWNGYPTDDEYTLYHGGVGVGTQPSGAPYGLDMALLDIRAGAPLTQIKRNSMGVPDPYKAGDSLPLALQSSSLDEIAEFSSGASLYGFLHADVTISEGSLWLRPASQWEGLSDGDEFPADSVTLTLEKYMAGAPRGGGILKYVRCVRSVN